MKEKVYAWSMNLELIYALLHKPGTTRSFVDAVGWLVRNIYLWGPFQCPFATTEIRSLSICRDQSFASPYMTCAGFVTGVWGTSLVEHSQIGTNSALY